MLTLRPAAREHMPFRQQLLADPATMAYNAPWFPPDGTIPFPEESWNTWLEKWTGHEPECFCGYVFDEELPVGEVCWHSHGAGMGVVIHASHRGKGYGAQALQLLARRAFSHPEISCLENTFESHRDPAMRLHLAAGFTPAGTDDQGMPRLCLTRSAWQETLLRRLTDAMCAWEKGVPQRIHHLIKVHGFARQIAQREGMAPDALFTLEAAALAHDIGIRPALEQTGACPGPLQERLGAPEAERMLHALCFPAGVMSRVSFLVAHHHTTQGVDALDWQILLEADFLVNMIENNASPEAIDAFRDKVFRTREGLALLEWIRPTFHETE